MSIKGEIRKSIASYTKEIYAAHSFKERQGIYERVIILGLSPDVFLLNALLRKSADKSESLYWWKLLLEHKLSPNVQSYMPLLSFCKDEAEKKECLQDMRKYGIEADLQMYCFLISLSHNQAEAQTWFAKVRDQVLANPGDATATLLYNALLAKLGKRSLIVSYHKEMQDNGIVADIRTYNILIRGAKDQAEADSYLAQMLVADIKPDSYTLSAYIVRVEATAVASAIKRFEKDYQVLMNIQIARTIIRSAPLSQRLYLMRLPALFPYRFDKVIKHLLKGI